MSFYRKRKSLSPTPWLRLWVVEVCATKSVPITTRRGACFELQQALAEKIGDWRESPGLGGTRGCSKAHRTI